MLMSSEKKKNKTLFERMWLNTLVYVRPVMLDGRCMYIIHAADGTPISIASGRESAFAVASQHDFSPVSLH
ncbi:MAG TPA: hypothetical protein DD400_01460 [Rhodospirillaceae bacterium]|nr:hypothetical protein [Rhodospirillaceae bacterium]